MEFFLITILGAAFYVIYEGTNQNTQNGRHPWHPWVRGKREISENNQNQDIILESKKLSILDELLIFCRFEIFSDGF